MISLSLREASLDKSFAAAFAMMYPLHTCTHPKTKNAWDLHTFPHHSFLVWIYLSLHCCYFWKPSIHKELISVEGCYFWQPLPLWRTLWVEVLYIVNVEDGMTILVWGQVAAVGRVSFGSNYSVSINCTYCMLCAVCNRIPWIACGWSFVEHSKQMQSGVVCSSWHAYCLLHIWQPSSRLVACSQLVAIQVLVLSLDVDHLLMNFCASITMQNVKIRK
jgi:hypothetical protein